MKKILVIDDEEWLREMVRKALREKGFDVIQAEKAYHGALMSLSAALMDHKVTEYRLRAILGSLIENPFKDS